MTATGVNRLYDGTAVATVNLAHNAIAGDDVTVTYAAASFADKHAGSAKPIEVTGISIGGTDGANYTLNGVTTAAASADISQRPLSITAVTDSRVYNGTVASAGVPTVGHALRHRHGHRAWPRPSTPSMSVRARRCRSRPTSSTTATAATTTW